MEKNISFEFNSVPAIIMEPFANLIRKSVYTLKETYAVCGISAEVSDYNTGSTLNVSPYNVLPNTTTSIVDFSILFGAKKYYIREDVIQDFENNGSLARMGVTSMQDLYRVSVPLDGVTSVSMKDFSDFFVCDDDSEMIFFNDKVVMTITFYIMKIQTDLSSQETEQILNIVNKNSANGKEVKVVALPAQLNTDLVSFDYSKKNEDKLTINVKYNAADSEVLKKIILTKLPKMLENVTFSES
jgi:hypothetical protein